MKQERLPSGLFAKLLIPDLLFTMGEGAVVALIQLYFVLRFHLLPGPLGVIFTISGLAGRYLLADSASVRQPLEQAAHFHNGDVPQRPVDVILVGFAPNIYFAIAGEYTRSFMRTLIEPVYAAFVMERVTDRHRATLSGFYGVTWSIGFSIGPTIAGWLQTNVSLSTAFVFGASCLVS